jgi:hypothetical protein
VLPETTTRGDDPSAAIGSETQRLAAFRAARDELKHRIEREIMDHT